MTISKYQKQQPPEEDYSGSEGSDYSDSDSDMDPSYSILENTQCQLSNLSINKKSKSRIGKDLEIERDPEDEDLVLKIIESGKLEKLKVEQCKVYLRKNGLRLTGNKDTLICRIKEHQEILNGGGEKKYPVCSFVLNCKGDACMGDVVMFEQKVYEMYNIASRSASGPPCGKRIVAGRIVNESYGAAKQQHTFTIEVLWSKGEKPLPPLHPLLIKGRNLYRLETTRQRWEDEEERRKVLMEKHTRGSVARDARETRVQEKERKKILRENRNLNKEKRNKNQLYSSSAAKQGIQTQESGSSVTKAALESRQPSLSVASGKMTVQRNESGEAQKPTTLPPLARPLANGVKMDDRPLQPAVMPQKTGSSIDILKMGTRPQPLAAQHQHQHQHQQSCLFKPTNQYSQGSGFPVETRKATFQHDQPKKQRENDNYYGVHQNLVDHSGQYNFSPTSSSFSTKDHYPPISKYSRTTWENGCLEGYRHSHRPSTSTNSYDGHHKYPLTSRNSYHSVSPLIIQGYQQQQPCKFYAQGRCKFGDNCKFLHDSR